MTERVAAGTWVEIYQVVLAEDERAPHLPEDTRHVPLEMRVRGWLVHAAQIDDIVEINTPTGRLLRGTLKVVNPAYTHGFGSPIAELSPIGGEVRALLRDKGWFK